MFRFWGLCTKIWINGTIGVFYKSGVEWGKLWQKEFATYIFKKEEVPPNNMNDERFGGQIIEETGLNADYRNELNDLLSNVRNNTDGIYVSDEMFILVDYKTYCRKHPNMGDDAINAANSESLQRVLLLAEEFNGLPLEQRKQESVVEQLVPKLNETLENKQISE